MIVRTYKAVQLVSTSFRINLRYAREVEIKASVGECKQMVSCGKGRLFGMSSATNR